MTLGELKQSFHKALTTLYPSEEVDALFFIAIEHLWNYSRIHYMLNAKEEIPSSQIAKVSDFLSQLKEGSPIQHIIGHTEFYRLQFEVSKDTLIPRPETEELVSLILNGHSEKSLTLLDIGTGTGCIPISLKHNRPQWQVLSCDISEKAIEVAQKNAKTLNTDISFICADILNDDNYNLFPQCDIVVSNPPYVTESEKVLMHKNVLDNDPHLALFVSDEDPLLFYRAITHFASLKLNPGGWLYFEINEAFGNEMHELLHSYGFQNCQLVKDINGKNRIIFGQLN